MATASNNILCFQRVLVYFCVNLRNTSFITTNMAKIQTPEDVPQSSTTVTLHVPGKTAILSDSFGRMFV